MAAWYSRRVRACAAAFLFAAAAAAGDMADMAKLKVFGDTPAEKGRWRMDILSMGKGGAAATAGHGMSVCLDSVMEMAKSQKDEANKSGCTAKVVQDTATSAVVETACDGDTVRSSITREGPRSFLVDVARTGKGEPLTLKARYAYEGPCSGDDAVLSFGKDSEACKNVRAQLANLDPKKACASAQGSQRTQCEALITQQRARLEAMCK